MVDLTIREWFKITLQKLEMINEGDNHEEGLGTG